MKKSIFQGTRSRLWGLVLLAVISVFGITSCTPDFNLDKETPEWLGPSIYDYLKNNHFDTYVKLIEDLGYKDVLSKTGSKTLFVADEAAVQRFYQSGIFKKADGTPVRNYEDLSLGQKKMILYGSMLNNVYQVAMLATASGPTLGESMRRPSTASEFSDVPLMKAAEMPNTEYFKYYRNNQKNIRIMRDASNKPMVFMINKFLVNHKILDDDYDFLFNQGDYDKTGTRPQTHQPYDASVNGINIDEQNIKCLNGFVHKVHDVIYPLPNIVEYLETSSNTEVYYSLLSRFCAPYPADKYFRPQISNQNWTGSYSIVRSNREKSYREYLEKDNMSDLLPAGDTLFELRFFSASLGAGPRDGNIITPSEDDNVSDKTLKFDPGWNSYYFAQSSQTADLALQGDMSVMLVPSDDAMMDWWNNGGGAAIKERYAPGTGDAGSPEEMIDQMKNVEDFVILDLINNNMLSSFTASVPSKFNDVLNDAQDPMGLTTADIDSVKLCCNGAIYITNKVMSPTSYKSVSFPTLVNPALRVINWAVGRWINGASTGCGFFAYLNSMQSEYSFFVPTVSDSSSPEDGKLVYIDPVSYGQDNYYAYVFTFDETLNKVTANCYKCDKDGVISDWSNPIKCTDSQVTNRLTDLLDYHVVIGGINNNKLYYQTKGRGTIKVDLGASAAFGGYQLENSKTCSISRTYNMSNGKTYIIDKPLLTSKKAVYDVINDNTNYPEFSEFYKLIETRAGTGSSASSVKSIILSPDADIQNKLYASDYNFNAFNTYYYTVYVPNNDSILELVNHGIITNNAQISKYTTIYNELKVLAIDFELAMSKVVYDNLSKDEAIMFVGTNPRTTGDYTQRHLDFTWTKFQKEVIKRNINFIKMHIQDKSLYVEATGTSSPMSYETAYINSKSIFEKVKVATAPNIMKVTGSNNIERQVSNDDRLRNIMCREYKYKNLQKSGEEASAVPKTISIDRGLIETSSFAVVHYIDGPLCSKISELEK